MTDDQPATGQVPIEAQASAAVAKVPSAPVPSGESSETRRQRWQTGPERLRSVLEDAAERQARRQREADKSRGWRDRFYDEDDGGDSAGEADTGMLWRPPGQPEWVITVLVGLYAEARSQQRLTGFNRTTRWVLEQAAARVDKKAVNAVPLKLLQALYLALGPRYRGWALWSHPCTARRTLQTGRATR